MLNPVGHSGRLRRLKMLQESNQLRLLSELETLPSELETHLSRNSSSAQLCCFNSSPNLLSLYTLDKRCRFEYIQRPSVHCITATLRHNYSQSNHSQLLAMIVITIVFAFRRCSFQIFDLSCG